jgi:hypothetical protein
MVNQMDQEQINNQVSKLKKMAESTAIPAVNLYIVMALRQLVKVFVLNEHVRFKVWRVNKAVECLRVIMQLSQCTGEMKNELIVIVCQLEKIVCSSGR